MSDKFPPQGATPGPLKDQGPSLIFVRSKWRIVFAVILGAGVLFGAGVYLVSTSMMKLGQKPSVDTVLNQLPLTSEFVLDEWRAALGDKVSIFLHQETGVLTVRRDAQDILTARRGYLGPLRHASPADTQASDGASGAAVAETQAVPRQGYMSLEDINFNLAAWRGEAPFSEDASSRALKEGFSDIFVQSLQIEPLESRSSNADGVQSRVKVSAQGVSIPKWGAWSVVGTLAFDEPYTQKLSGLGRGVPATEVYFTLEELIWDAAPMNEDDAAELLAQLETWRDQSSLSGLESQGLKEAWDYIKRQFQLKQPAVFRVQSNLAQSHQGQVHDDASRAHGGLSLRKSIRLSDVILILDTIPSHVWYPLGMRPE